MVLLEAMAARVPIVATRVGGVPDVVSTAEAVLVPSGEPDAIADTFTRIQTGRAAARRRPMRRRYACATASRSNRGWTSTRRFTAG
jgi:glycosyltransferase involved in cell wall biosynthesis